MSIAAIQEWLDSPTRNYGVGVQYFSKYSTNSFLKKLFLKSEDDYNFNRLMRELQSIVDDAINPPKPEVPPIIESDAAPAAPEEDVPAVPEITVEDAVRVELGEELNEESKEIAAVPIDDRSPDEKREDNNDADLYNIKHFSI